ncbi:hypothetical protein ACYX7E_08020 [Luteimonas sp. RIT-PG2_3]
MEIIQGKARVLDRDTETHGYVSGSGGRVSGQTSSMRTVTLEVAGRTVIVKHKQPIAVIDGDEVVAAGPQKAEGLLAYGFANRTRATRNKSPAGLMLLLGGLMVALGIPLSVILVGLIFVGFGGYCLWLGAQMSKANKLLESTLAAAGPVPRS